MAGKAERTRQFIIEKASHLFNKKGFHGTSMSDILGATGLAKGGVYGNFNSKEEIVKEAFLFSFKKVTEELSIRIRGAATAPEKLISVLDYYYNYNTRGPIDGGCPIVNYTTHASDDSLPELRNVTAQAVRTMLSTIEHILIKGVQYNQLRKDLDCKLAARVVYSRIEGALMLSKALQDDHYLNGLLDELKKEILKWKT